VPGETRAEEIVPAHPNGIQLSRDRWLTLFATRGYRGLDDDRSVVYQVRRDNPCGPVVKEGCLAASTDEWDPLSDGSRLVKQCGHPVAFGVPKGARIAGGPAPHANVFAATWRITPRVLDRGRNYLVHWSEAATPPVDAVEWVQFRLNDTDDDIEFITRPTRLRQRGYESGPAFCGHETATMMNQSFVTPVPMDHRAEQWVVTNHFGASLAALRYTFDPKLGRYVWTDIGPFLNDERKLWLIEASTLRRGDDWLVAARTGWGQQNIAWFRTDDLFTKPALPTVSDGIKSDAPHTAYLYPDGVVRVLGGDATVSPYGKPRCPLYLWDIDPDAGFRASNRRVVFDPVERGLPLPLDTNPTADMAKLMPHPGGDTGYIIHRVRSDTMNFPSACTPLIVTPAERDATAIYWAKITYDRDYPAPWRFAERSAATPAAR
jgi:hypothetical protein